MNVVDQTFNTACAGATTTQECLAATQAALGAQQAPVPRYTPELCKVGKAWHPGFFASLQASSAPWCVDGCNHTPSMDCFFLNTASVLEPG